MSNRVMLVCLALMMLGLMAASESVLKVGGALQAGTASFFFNPAIFFVPVSIALFLKLRGARLGATIVFAMCYSVLLFILLGSASMSYYGGSIGTETPSLRGIGWARAAFYLHAAILIALHWSLYSDFFSEHLER